VATATCHTADSNAQLTSEGIFFLPHRENLCLFMLIIICNIAYTTRSTYGFCFIGHFADNFQYNYQTGTISQHVEGKVFRGRSPPTHPLGRSQESHRSHCADSQRCPQHTAGSSSNYISTRSSINRHCGL